MPIKDPYFATLKSNNYLPNALVALDAQLEGFDQAMAASQMSMHRHLHCCWPSFDVLCNPHAFHMLI